MLSYRHAFHAGNYADVLKHLVICRILTHMTQKDAPMCYVETHAGAGCYKLTSAEAKKTGEYHQGIGLLWDKQDLPPPLAEYVQLVRQLNTGKKLLQYPGSPWFAHQILRPYDRLELCELHPQDFPLLDQMFKKDRKVHCHFEDGFKRSIALLPPVEKRGLIVIDPSYEIKQDYTKVVDHLKLLHKRFATGIYALWYPIVEQRRINKLEQALIATGIRHIRQYEVSLGPDHDEKGMTGSGMIVINPPWKLDEDLRHSLEYFTTLLSPEKKSSYRITQLVAE